MSWDETQKYVLKSHLTQPKLAEHFEQAPLISWIPDFQSTKWMKLGHMLCSNWLPMIN